jgi:hypothetical protein
VSDWDQLRAEVALACRILADTGCVREISSRKAAVTYAHWTWDHRRLLLGEAADVTKRI